MSRILHHVGRNDFKKTRQRQIGEKKECAAKELKERQEAEAERKIIEEAAKPFKSDWRLDFLSEAMTTAGLGMVNHPAEGDVDLEGVIGTAVPGTSGSGGSGGSYSFGTYDETGNGGFVLYLDTTKYDTLKFNVNRGGASSIRVSINGGTFQPLIGGTNRITISSANRGKRIQFVFNASKPGAQSGSTGASISGTVFQRRTPINVFVPLDDPEANSFIRGGLGGSEERRQRLKEQLESGNELMIRMGLEPSKTSPGDIELAQAYPPGGPNPYGTPGADDPYEDGPFPDDPFDDSDFEDPFPDLDLAMNQGPSTPVKYDADMNQLVPNQGGGRPGKIRLKGKAKLA